MRSRYCRYWLNDSSKVGVPSHENQVQIRVPPQLDDVLKAYTKEVIRRKPEDLVEFSAFYFANLANIVPETSVVVQPTIQQIESLYRELSNANDSTCDV